MAILCFSVPEPDAAQCCLAVLSREAYILTSLLFSSADWGFPKTWGTLLGVPIIRIIVDKGLHSGPSISSIWGTTIFDVGRGPAQALERVQKRAAGKT